MMVKFVLFIDEYGPKKSKVRIDQEQLVVTRTQSKLSICEPRNRKAEITTMRYQHFAHKNEVGGKYPKFELTENVLSSDGSKLSTASVYLQKN